MSLMNWGLIPTFFVGYDRGLYRFCWGNIEAKNLLGVVCTVTFCICKYHRADLHRYLLEWAQIAIYFYI
jgi:hypothetical protein